MRLGGVLHANRTLVQFFPRSTPLANNPPIGLAGEENGRAILGTDPDNAVKALVPRSGQRNQVQVTPPGGLYGARGSRLLRLLRTGHNGVKLSAPGLRRLAAWIDLNAIFYGTNDPEEQAAQLAGKRIALPKLQ